MLGYLDLVHSIDRLPLLWLLYSLIYFQPTQLSLIKNWKTCSCCRASVLCINWWYLDIEQSMFGSTWKVFTFTFCIQDTLFILSPILVSLKISHIYQSIMFCSVFAWVKLPWVWCTRNTGRFHGTSWLNGCSLGAIGSAIFYRTKWVVWDSMLVFTWCDFANDTKSHIAH